MKTITNEAVSPVIGVLLMLVVTIIIAAVVSAFAGGLSSEQSKAPQVSFTVKPEIVNISDTNTGNYNPDHDSGYTAANGILFEHKGGDSISLNEIAIHLEDKGVSMIVTGSDKLSTTYNVLPSDITDGGYFAKVGNDVSDKIIEPGDKFMMYADDNYISQGTKYLIWEFPTGRGYAPVNDKIKYTVIDRRSNKAICNGEFVLK
ncbi:type IV pilin N-terminal domain-containing protein [Methanospirillum purgamenti]|jgi:flagellin-like protein|uniref:Type IV pilin N-terminal domain-containing protein n=1 Tax=Methanospirillum hungatei TaxID=2203 RepID=A0A8F5VR07_METHU|nr:type IV pilin N-terminal domain-containing protein [Methanospirillum hungatei]QXO95748.1 type IV pilin N-terminal domain-containing protein [Methanospirillum hungatei]